MVDFQFLVPFAPASVPFFMSYSRPVRSAMVFFSSSVALLPARSCAAKMAALLALPSCCSSRIASWLPSDSIIDSARLNSELALLTPDLDSRIARVRELILVLSFPIAPSTAATFRDIAPAAPLVSSIAELVCLSVPPRLSAALSAPSKFDCNCERNLSTCLLAFSSWSVSALMI